MDSFGRTACACCAFQSPSQNIQSFLEPLQPPPQHSGPYPSSSPETLVTVAQAFKLLFRLELQITQNLWICANCVLLTSRAYYPLLHFRQCILDTESFISDALTLQASTSSPTIKHALLTIPRLPNPKSKIQIKHETFGPTQDEDNDEYHDQEPPDYGDGHQEEEDPDYDPKATGYMGMEFKPQLPSHLPKRPKDSKHITADELEEDEDSDSDFEIRTKKRKKDALASKQPRTRSKKKIKSEDDERQGFPCSYTGCTKVCGNSGALSVHMKIIHKKRYNYPQRQRKRKRNIDPQEPVTCTICDREFKHQAFLQQHMQVHRDEFDCPYCEAKFNDKTILRTHKRDAHPEELDKLLDKNFFKCTVEGCDKRYTNRKGLKLHVLSHDPNYVKPSTPTSTSSKKLTKSKPCPLCHKEVIGKYLKEHILSAHSTERPFLCPKPECGKTFRMNKELQRHLRDMHSGISYPCNVCGIILKSKKNLSSHALVHLTDAGPPPSHLCEECGRSYKTAQSLHLHIKHLHRYKEKFRCPHCPKTFGTKNTFRNHVEGVHGEPQFTCQYCGNRYKQELYLKLHEAKAHFEEAGDSAFMYKCDICDQKFGRSHHLRAHRLKENHYQAGQEPNQEMIQLVKTNNEQVPIVVQLISNAEEEPQDLQQEQEFEPDPNLEGLRLRSESDGEGEPMNSFLTVVTLSAPSQ